MSNPRDLLDLAALSDPTDSHSLAELRAHLEDGGDMEPKQMNWGKLAKVTRELELMLDDCDDEDLNSYLVDTDYIIGQVYYGLNRLAEYAEERQQASERSGGDGA